MDLVIVPDDLVGLRAEHDAFHERFNAAKCLTREARSLQDDANRLLTQGDRVAVCAATTLLGRVRALLNRSDQILTDLDPQADICERWARASNQQMPNHVSPDTTRGNRSDDDDRGEDQ